MKITNKERLKIELAIESSLMYSEHIVQYPEPDTMFMNVRTWCDDERYSQNENLIFLRVLKDKEEDGRIRWRVFINNVISTDENGAVFNKISETYYDDEIYQALTEFLWKVQLIDSAISEFKVVPITIKEKDLGTLRKMIESLKPWDDYGTKDDEVSDYWGFSATKDSWRIRKNGTELNGNLVLYYDDNVVLSGFPKEIVAISLGVTDSVMRQQLFNMFLEVKK